MSDTLPPLPEPETTVLIAHTERGLTSTCWRTPGMPYYTADQMRSYAAVALAAAVAEPTKLCMCKDRPLSECPGEWEPGCDLGNNPAFVRVAAAAVAEPVEPVTLADVLDALNLFNRPKPSEDDGPWEGGHFIRVDYLPAFINTIAAAWFSHKPMAAPAAPPQREPLTDAQIEDCIDASNRAFNIYRSSGPIGQQITTMDDWKYWLARAIERAHGITKEAP